MKTPTKRRVGRPRKQPENPDCEVATKGFVKCVARKTLCTTHTHKIQNTNDLTISLGALTMLSAILSALGYVIAVMNHMHEAEIFLAPIFWMSVIIFSSCLLAESHTIIASALADYTPDYLKKYVEPPCEPKRGCEEQE